MKIFRSTVLTGFLSSFVLAASASAATPVKLAFTTGAQTVNVNQCSQLTRVKLQDSYSNNVTSSTNRSVSLSGTGFTFYSDSSCSNRVSAVTIPAGNAGKAFYFKNTTAGSQTITASSSGLASARQTETIKSVSTPSPTPTATATSTPSPTATPTPSPTPTKTVTPTPTPTPTSTQAGLRPMPSWLYGVTTDRVNNMSALLTSLKSLSKTPITRVVFDEFVAASYYKTPVSQINAVSYVMGELLDSYYVKQYTVDQYIQRTTEYLDALGESVDLWEVGNEVNGEWLGTTSDVVAKVKGAYDLVKARGYRTELTLYYNQDCWANKSNEMFTWTQNNIPADMKQGLDYVLVSYYEDDCNGLKPDWPTVFSKLHQMFPNSKIGIGEMGTTRAAAKADFINRYYKMNPGVPNFVGGNFYWYFNPDMVPYTNSLWSTLNSAIQ